MASDTKWSGRATQGDFSGAAGGLIFAAGTPQVTGDPRVSGKHVNLRLYQVDQRQGNKNQQYSKGLPDGHFPVDIWRMVQ